jgi:hypothetical protein
MRFSFSSEKAVTSRPMGTRAAELEGNAVRGDNLLMGDGSDAPAAQAKTAREWFGGSRAL